MAFAFLTFFLLSTLVPTAAAEDAEVPESCAAGARNCQAEEVSDDPPATNLVQVNFKFKKEKIKADSAAGVSIVHSSVATERARARVRLGIEKDLSKMGKHVYRAWDIDQDCAENADEAFDHFLIMTNLSTELLSNETEHWKARVVSELEAMCKLHDPDQGDQADSWLGDFMKALQQEKPVITQAIADALNNASLGFQVRVDAWMLFESALHLQERSGAVMTEAENTTAFLQTEKYYGKHYDKSLKQATPDSFDPVVQWPLCAAVLTRIHNQGVCGSCWAFAAMSGVDSQVCIASNGSFQGQLSRGVITSCSTENGCNGGWMTYAYDYIASTPGVPTGGSDGCRPYFAHGEGTDHFQSSMPAPPCSVTCQPSYHRNLADDSAVLPGIRNYRNIMPTNAAGNADAKVAIMTYGPVPYAIHADNALFAYSSGIYSSGCGLQVNHGVTAIGWGFDTEDFWVTLNSWGEHWGDNGGFKSRTCTIGGWTIPGDVTSDVQLMMGDNMPFGVSSPTPPPPPSPPTSPPSFTVSGDCVEDQFGCVSSPNYPLSYANSQGCQIDGYPTFTVEDFSTEASYDKLCLNGECYHGGSGGCPYQTPSTPPPLVTPTTSITWTSDYSVVGGGWKICPVGDPVVPDPTPAPVIPEPTSPPVPPGGGSSGTFIVADGGCVASEDGACVSSPGYPQAYHNGGICTISVSENPGHIEVDSFLTETNWDFLFVNGLEYHGEHSPQDVVPTSQIEWYSDCSVTRSGWRLCLAGSPAPPPANPTPAPVIEVPVLREHGCPVLGDQAVASFNVTTRSGANQCCTGASGDELRSVSCLRNSYWWGGTYMDAKLQCEADGYRLCDTHEIGRCCRQGFGIDRKNVWAMEAAAPQTPDTTTATTTAVPTPAPSATGVSPMQMAAIVLKHNELRSSMEASDMMKMEWNSELAARAQAHSSTCPSSHTDSSILGTDGENMAGYAGSSFVLTDQTDVTDSVQQWFNEKADSGTYQNGGQFTGFDSCTGTCGHYTQVVWASANEIGCGLSSCPMGSMPGYQLTCQYSTSLPGRFGGNMMGSTIFTPGTACSACPIEPEVCVDGLCVHSPV